jgi:hypothetical protein
MEMPKNEERNFNRPIRNYELVGHYSNADEDLKVF